MSSILHNHNDRALFETDTDTNILYIQHDFLCPYINLPFKPTISPTLRAPLACNQWQHLLQCRSATGQDTQKDAEKIIDLLYKSCV